MDNFFQWLFDATTGYGGETNWAMVFMVGFLALVVLVIVTLLVHLALDAANTAFVASTKRPGKVLEHAYTPAESGTRWEVQPSHAGNAYNGINMGSTTMVPVAYHNPERHSLKVEVDGRTAWLGVSRSAYEQAKVNDKVDVIGVVGRFSRRFEPQSILLRG